MGSTARAPRRALVRAAARQGAHRRRPADLRVRRLPAVGHRHRVWRGRRTAPRTSSRSCSSTAGRTSTTSAAPTSTTPATTTTSLTDDEQLERLDVVDADVDVHVDDHVDDDTAPTTTTSRRSTSPPSTSRMARAFAWLRIPGSASTTSSSPESGGRISRRGPATTRRRRCPAAGQRGDRRPPHDLRRTVPRPRRARTRRRDPHQDPVRRVRLPDHDDRDRRRRRLAGDRHGRPDDGHADVDHVPSDRDGVAADDRPRRARSDAVHSPRTGGVQLRPRDCRSPRAPSSPATT